MQQGGYGARGGVAGGVGVGGGMYRGRGGRGRGHQGLPGHLEPARQDHRIKFTDDFDFESANAEFENVKSKLGDLSLNGDAPAAPATASTSASVENGAVVVDGKADEGGEHEAGNASSNVGDDENPLDRSKDGEGKRLGHMIENLGD